jgi:hypothetical protein
MPLDHDPYGLFIVYAIDTMKSTGEITSIINITNKVTLKFRCIVPLSGDVVSYSLGAVS